MKAALLEEDEDEKLLVTDCFFEEFESPLCRQSTQEDGLHLVTSAIGKFLEEKDVENIPIWANVSAARLVSRFVRLPPVNDKAAAKLIEQEIGQKIPIELDELSIVRWMAGLANEGDVHGRPAVITAAKNQVITERLALLEEAGLTVTGLQADTVALVNFAVHEFSDLLTMEAGKIDDDSQHDDETEAVTGTKDDDGDDDASRPPAIAIVDSGAASTSLIIVSAESHWSWTIETGGEDLTKRLARSTKETHGTAEESKRNPAALSMPAKEYETIEQRQEEMRMRLETSFSDALKQNPRFNVVQSWCVGGGCLSHGWIRRVLVGPMRAATL
jgi:Tfp pilus assembly PilM family ATPase